MDNFSDHQIKTIIASRNMEKLKALLSWRPDGYYLWKRCWPSLVQNQWKEGLGLLSKSFKIPTELIEEIHLETIKTKNQDFFYFVFDEITPNKILTLSTLASRLTQKGDLQTLSWIVDRYSNVMSFNFAFVSSLREFKYPEISEYLAGKADPIYAFQVASYDGDTEGFLWLKGWVQSGREKKILAEDFKDILIEDKRPTVRKRF